MKKQANTIYTKRHGIRRLKPEVDFADFQRRFPDAIKIDYLPGPDEMEDFEFEAIDGCHVDPDGCCEHGCPSWLLAFGLI